MTTKKKKTAAPDFSKYLRWFWILFSGGILSIALVFLLASWGVFGDLPTFEELENPKSDLATQVISADGKILGTYYIDANRKPIQYQDLPKNLIEALVATEDERFYDHSGIDARGLLRAMAKFGAGGGASTITQQLAKNLFTKKASQNTVKRIIQKVKEWIVATRLERQYTKEEIIAMYLNTQGFLFKATGIRSAAQIYFDKEPKDLDLQESAILVAMLKNPRQFNPHRKISRNKSKARRNVVFLQMAKNGLISELEKDSLQKLSLKIKFTPETHNDGMGTYFREYLRDELKDWAKNTKKPDGKPYNIYKDGLKIYTTIDSRMQKYAEDAVQQHMPRLQKEFFRQNAPKHNPTTPFLDLTRGAIDTLMRRSMWSSERWRHMKYDLKKSNKEIEASFHKPIKMTIFEWKDGVASEVDTVMKPWDSMRYYKSFLRTGMMSMDPLTGHVKAWVGGMNYKHFKYDMVKQGKRQIGSTFKPFVYATAIDQLHYSPCDEFPDTPYCIEKLKHGNMEEWCPRNSGGEDDYGGKRTLQNALANSVNTITARLIDKVGPQPVVDLARKLGVESDILPVPSIALGTPDLSVYEMVGAYATFANKGVYIKPIMITAIEDKNGTVLYNSEPETRDVLSQETAYVAVKLMEGVTQHGSGARLRKKGADAYRQDYKRVVTGYPYEFENDIAGKTGTTQNQSDGWFMGMVPNLVTGVWVGGEDRAVHFPGITYGQGAAMALPIWGVYMKSCYADATLNISQEAFEAPEELSIEVDCSKMTDKNVINDTLYDENPDDLEGF